MYACVNIVCEKESIKFYTQFLKFNLYENVKQSIDEEWWILRKDKQEKTGLILIKKNHENHHKSTVIIPADDCILEYCKLRENEVKELSEPSYSSLGMSINFLDPSGNKIMLLEERKYSDLEI